MAEFMLVAMDQVINEAPRFRGMSGGQVKVPIVLKAGYGFTAGWAGQHTGTINALFMGVPGLKVAVPSTAADAKGPDGGGDPRRQPGRLPAPLPADARARRGAGRRVPRPASARRRSGARAATSRSSASAGRSTARSARPSSSPSDGIQAEVIDPRTLAPLDTQTILESVEKTGRLVLVDQATRHASASTVIAGEVRRARLRRR